MIIHILFAIFLLATVSTIANSAPAITEVQGSFLNGEPVIITGAEFGDGPDVSLFDDFNSRASWDDGNVPNSATIGQWDSQDFYLGDENIGYAYVVGHRTLLIQNIESSGGVTRNLPITNTDVFFSFRAFIPDDKNWPGATSDTDWSPANWKIVWLKHNNNSSAGGSDLYMPAYLGHTGPPSFITATISGNNSPVNDEYSPGIKKGEWFRLSGWVKGATDATGQVHLWEMTESLGKIQKSYLNNIATLQSDDATHIGPYYHNTFI